MPETCPRGPGAVWRKHFHGAISYQPTTELRGRYGQYAEAYRPRACGDSSRSLLVLVVTEAILLKKHKVHLWISDLVSAQ
jgi:hypothetical protein